MEHPLGNPEELAACYASGAMTTRESGEFEAHLAGCPHCRGELATLQPVVSALLEAVPWSPPSAATRAAVLARAAAAPPGKQAWKQPWKEFAASAEQPGIQLIRNAGDGPWEPTGVEGVRVRRLYVDRAHNRMTALFRMAAGATYPGHAHGGVEECWVLEGDLISDGMVMHAGDYQRAATGSRHGHATRGGCLLLISSSLGDEVLPD